MQNGFVLFDVVYEDGHAALESQDTAIELGGLDGDEPARTHIEMQDRKIARCRYAASAHQDIIVARAKRRPRIAKSHEDVQRTRAKSKAH
jgi:hypothetical protein